MNESATSHTQLQFYTFTHEIGKYPLMGAAASFFMPGMSALVDGAFDNYSLSC
jgi:hypothetical protein